jgi:hypothetical protein
MDIVSGIVDRFQHEFLETRTDGHGPGDHLFSHWIPDERIFFAGGTIPDIHGFSCLDMVHWCQRCVSFDVLHLGFVTVPTIKDDMYYRRTYMEILKIQPSVRWNIRCFAFLSLRKRSGPR